MTTRTTARPSTWRRSRLALLGAAVSLLATGVTTTVTTGTAHAATWTRVPGVANDIGISPSGVLWATGLDGKVYRNSWDFWVEMGMPGFGVRLTVDLNGNAWVVRSDNTIRRYNGSGWESVSGSTRDLGNGGGGQIWRASTTGTVYRWNWTTSGWNNMGGSDVVRIDAEVGGVAWVVQSDGDIWRWNSGTSWVPIDGQAQDIGVGSAGNQWATGEASGNATIYERVSGTWTSRGGAARNIDVDQSGRAWVVQTDGSIWGWL